MPRYILAVALHDNTVLTFDSKRAGGLDHLFEQVGNFIGQVGNDNVRECLLTAVADDYEPTFDITEYANTPSPKVLSQPFGVMPDTFNGKVSEQRQAMHEQHKTGLSLTPGPMALEQILSAEPVGAPCLLARRMTLANMVIRNTPEWKPFLESDAYCAYIRLLDSPLASTPEDIVRVKEGYNAYRQAIIDYGTEHNLLKPLLPR